MKRAITFLQQTTGVTAVAATLLWSLPASAANPYGLLPGEVVFLPEVCQVVFTAPRNAPERKQWQARYGDMWHHIHHYCHAMKYLHRSTKPMQSKQDKLYNLTSALDEFRYVIDHTKPGHWFLPQVHLQKATVLSRLGRTKEAAAEYAKARAGTAAQAQ